MSLLTNPNAGPFSLDGSLAGGKYAPVNPTALALGLGDPSAAYGDLSGLSPSTFSNGYTTMDMLKGNVPLPPVRPQSIALNTPQATNQGGGGGNVPTPPPRPAGLDGTPTGSTTPAATDNSNPLSFLSTLFGSSNSNSNLSSTSGSPFSTQDPNSFVSKLFGPAGSANQQPLVRPNSIVGRLAHLFMNNNTPTTSPTVS